MHEGTGPQAQKLTEKLNMNLLINTTLCVLIGLLVSSTDSWGQSSQLAAAKVAKLRDEQVRESMLAMSRQLGVNCLTCHENENFTTDKKREFKIAKDHLRLVQVLIDAGMNGTATGPKADCYLCHRGELKPAFQEPIDPLVMKKGDGKKADSEHKTGH